jgi:hypothetical protein
MATRRIVIKYMLVYTSGIKNASEDSASFGQLPMSESSTGVKKTPRNLWKSNYCWNLNA